MEIKDKYQNLKGKELFKYLSENKKELIKLKKCTPQNGASIPYFGEYEYYDTQSPTTKSIKAVKMEDDDNEELDVSVIANMTNLIDSDNDVVLTGAYNKTIADKGNSIPFIKDHTWSISSIIADTLAVYTKNINLESIGVVNSDIKQSEALIFRGLVKKEYDEKLYYLYKNNKVDQHSIGLQYVNLQLAVNDPEFEEEFKIWEDVYEKIINKKKADEDGFFWAVKEIKVFENSAVLFAANKLTPTLEVIQRSAVIDTEPQSDGPVKTTTSNKSSFNVKHLF